jgi:hypothetical protein
MSASYAKLRNGSWGVRVTGESVQMGDRVTVTKKDGQECQETIAKVLWNGTDKNDGQKVYLCAVEVSSVPPQKRRDIGRDADYWRAKRSYEETGDYYGSGLYDEES